MPVEYARFFRQVYLSYGDPDKERVEQVYDRLLAARLNPWMRSRDIRAGEAERNAAAEDMRHSESFEETLERTERLLRDRVNQLIGSKDIRAGEAERSAIGEAIGHSDLFVVILSSGSAPDSEEIDQIIGSVGSVRSDFDVERIIPVLLDKGCEVPDSLSGWYAVMDLSDEEGWDPLLDRLDPLVRSSLPELKVPDDLIQACADGQCVLFAGDGLSVQAGFAPRRAFILRLLDWAMEKELLDTDRDWLRAWREEVKTGDAELIANNIYEALYHPFEGKTAQTSPAAETNKHLEPLYAYLRDMYARPGTPPPESQVLTEVGFTAAMTTNLDHLLEAAFVDTDPPLFTPEETEGLREAFGKRKFFMLKLHGSVHEPGTLCIAPAQFEDAVRRNEPFLQSIQTLFLSRSVLFVGADLEAINTFLEAIQLRPRVEAPQHYALTPVVDSSWQAQADRLQRYGIQVLPYALLEERRVMSFLEELAEKVQTRRHETVEVQKGPARLRSVRLENIGPFEVLKLELDPHWNIMLGDNGVGKSSILKAIAVGILGKDAQPRADRLIRSGKEIASITLETTEGSRYVTEITRTDSGAKVRARTVRPLDAEGWLALGFPPLRTFSWTRLKGPDPQEPKRRPTSQDLLPLIKDEPDPRMDGLKQWVMNLDYWSSKQQDIKATVARRYKRLLEEFFQVVNQLTTGVTVKFDNVNPQTGKITIITDDGPVPIESLSQGTESLIGWTGILLRRLYEMYGDEEDFRKKYALVLMDELDAHMHPAWQQSLVHNLSELFPNVQFIATTHSPLVVGGMDVKQVVRLARRDGRVMRLDVDEDMTMGRADQVLTGSLFGLKTTLDKPTQQEIENYQELLRKRERTPEEEDKLREFPQVLRLRIPVAYETPPERRAYELVQALLLQQVMELSSTAEEDSLKQAEQRLLEKARQLLDEVQGSRGGER